MHTVNLSKSLTKFLVKVTTLWISCPWIKAVKWNWTLDMCVNLMLTEFRWLNRFVSILILPSRHRTLNWHTNVDTTSLVHINISITVWRHMHAGWTQRWLQEDYCHNICLVKFEKLRKSYCITPGARCWQWHWHGRCRQNVEVLH